MGVTLSLLTHIHMHAHTHTHARMHACTQIHTRMHAHTHAHTHIHSNTHTHTFTHDVIRSGGEKLPTHLKPKIGSDNDSAVLVTGHETETFTTEHDKQLPPNTATPSNGPGETQAHGTTL